MAYRQERNHNVGWRQKIVPVKQFLTTGDVLLLSKLANAKRSETRERVNEAKLLSIFAKLTKQDDPRLFISSKIPLL